VSPDLAAGYTDRNELDAKVRAVVDALASIVRPAETTRMHVLQVLAHVVAGALGGTARVFVTAYVARIRELAAAADPAAPGAPWSTDELQQQLDLELAEIIKDLRLRSRFDGVDFAATVSAFLLRSGLTLAATHGAPREIVRAHLEKLTDETWSRQGRTG
jgi:hypothetical protein